MILPLQAHVLRGQTPPHARHFVPPRNRESGWGKPLNGTAFWTSTVDTLLDIGWVGWCRSENYANPEAYWALQPTEARVFEVATAEDVLAIHERYGVPPPVHWTSERYSGLDWEKIALEWDAVRLVNPYGDGIRFSKVASSFYGWDCESTCWLRWCFEPTTTRVELPHWDPPCWQCGDRPCTC